MNLSWPVGLPNGLQDVFVDEYLHTIDAIFAELFHKNYWLFRYNIGFYVCVLQETFQCYSNSINHLGYY